MDVKESESGTGTTDTQLEYGEPTKEVEPGTGRINTPLEYGMTNKEVEPGIGINSTPLEYGEPTKKVEPGTGRISTPLEYGEPIKEVEPGTGKINTPLEYGEPTKEVEPGTGIISLVWMGETLNVGIEEYEMSENVCRCEKNENVENWETNWDTTEGNNADFWLEDRKKEEMETRKMDPRIVKKLRRKEWLEKTNPEVLEDMDKI